MNLSPSEIAAIRERAEKATTIPTKCDVDSEHNAAMLKFWLYESVDRIAEFQSDLARVTLERDEAVGLLREIDKYAVPTDSACDILDRMDAFLSRLDQPQEKST